MIAEGAGTAPLRVAGHSLLMQPAIDLTARLSRLGDKLREGLPAVA